MLPSFKKYFFLFSFTFFYIFLFIYFIFTDYFCLIYHLSIMLMQTQNEGNWYFLPFIFEHLIYRKLFGQNYFLSNRLFLVFILKPLLSLIF